MTNDKPIGIDWVVQEVLKNSLMHLEPVVRLRKRFFSRQNDPGARIGDYFDLQWETYSRALKTSISASMAQMFWS